MKCKYEIKKNGGYSCSHPKFKDFDGDIVNAYQCGTFLKIETCVYLRDDKLKQKKT